MGPEDEVPNADLTPRRHADEGKADVLARVAAAIDSGDLNGGRETLTEHYPFTPIEKSARKSTERQCLRLFYRDGFLDRYSGSRLVNPEALRLLSVLLPTDFPADPNWAMGRSHFAFWELFPTIDHVHPVARGGADSEANWVSTSMLRNSAKAHWTVDELGWTLHPPGEHTDWDGLTAWFVKHMQVHPKLLANSYLARWHRASVDVRSQLP